MSDSKHRGIPPHILYPGMVLALLLMSFTFATITIIKSVGDRSFAVEPDYYAKAINYDDVIDQHARNAELGWKLEAPRTIDRDDSGSVVWTATVSDQHGEPIENASIEIEAFGKLRSKERFAISGKPVSPGVYHATMEITTIGAWELRWVITDAAGNIFTETTTTKVR